jgi:chemotaxis protein histidine kinase CheA
MGLRGVLVLAVAAVACGGSERRIIDQYFNALRAEDSQTLSSFAAVQFDKKVDKWSITQVLPETKAPATLPDLTQKVKDIDKEIADNKKAASAYALEHLAEWEQVSEARKKDAKIPPKLQDAAKEYDGFSTKDRDLRKALAEAKNAADAEKRRVRLSVGELSDLETLNGEVTSRDVELLLTIGGQAQPYLMELKKYDLEQSADKGRVMSRWMVHDLRPKS